MKSLDTQEASDDNTDVSPKDLDKPKRVKVREILDWSERKYANEPDQVQSGKFSGEFGEN